MVLISSTNEEIIEPIISCHFGSYKLGSTTQIELLTEKDWYKNDILGLKTLNESGRLHLKMANCYHAEYQADEDNFTQNILPFLLPPNTITS